MCTRFVTPCLVRRRETCALTVASLINSDAATSAFDAPDATAAARPALPVYERRQALGNEATAICRFVVAEVREKCAGDRRREHRLSRSHETMSRD